jgi:hypothetical protein
MLMARRRGKLARAVLAGEITAEEAKKKMAEKYNRKAEKVMPERWERARVYIPDRWAASVSALLGAAVDPSFKESLKSGLEAAKDVYPKRVKGKGETLVKHYYEKLTTKVAG